MDKCHFQRKQNIKNYKNLTKINLFYTKLNFILSIFQIKILHMVDVKHSAKFMHSIANDSIHFKL